MLHDIRLPDRIWLTSGGAFVVATIGYWSPTALLSIVFAAYSLVLIALSEFCVSKFNDSPVRSECNKSDAE